jgi:uncharacterized membrane protein YbhN (UPF0104 family)
MTVSARRIVRMAGLLLSAIAIAWIALRFAQSGALGLLERNSISNGGLVAVIAMLAAAYAAAELFLAIAWWRLIVALAADHDVPAVPTMGAYAVSQYGKYLPGNVAHYAIRHAWIRRYGISHAALALASIVEAALLLLAACALTLLGDTRGLRALSIIDPRLALASLVVALVALGFFLHALGRGRMRDRFHIPPLPPLRMLSICIACYGAFFVASAACLYGLAQALAIPGASFALLLAAGAASWLAGFVVIGAPGGLGVREAAFVALAGSTLGEDHALLLIGLFRIVTFLGDTLFLAAGTVVLRLQRKRAP